MEPTPAIRAQRAYRQRQREKLEQAERHARQIKEWEEASATLVERDKQHVATIDRLESALREITAQLGDSEKTGAVKIRKIAETALADQGKAA